MRSEARLSLLNHIPIRLRLLQLGNLDQDQPPGRAAQIVALAFQFQSAGRYEVGRAVAVLLQHFGSAGPEFPFSQHHRYIDGRGAEVQRSLTATRRVPWARRTASA
jgi:hypothetical protein